MNQTNPDMRRAIQTPEAPQAIGPYSQAVRAGNLLFVSGQIPLHPRSGEVQGATVEEQADQVMKNLMAILGAEGLGPQHLIKTTIYLTDLAGFAKVNEVYGRYLVAPHPARATVQVSRLPRDVLVEIEGIAIYPG